MKFRVARHTNNLEEIKAFYTNVLYFEVLGTFENHDGYDGIFIGKPGLDWHLEFTQSNENAVHIFDEDDILVFYPTTNMEYNNLMESINRNKIDFVASKNSYWNENGKMILDPDGYRIIVSDIKL